MSLKTAVTGIDEVLVPAGFRRRKAAWNRKLGAFVDVIDVQTSKGGDAITINAGVMHSGVYEKSWGTEPPEFVEEPSCIVRARIGELTEGKDLWWQLTDTEIAGDLSRRIAERVLPFLERMHSLESMEWFLIDAQVMKKNHPLPIIYLAVLKFERGDKTGACGLLTEFRNKTVAAWQTKIGGVTERIGCLRSESTA